jgi:hypothetical protein
MNLINYFRSVTNLPMQGNLTEKEGFSTVDLLIKAACFVIKVTDVLNIKEADTNLYTRRSTFTEPSPSVRIP